MGLADMLALALLHIVIILAIGAYVWHCERANPIGRLTARERREAARIRRLQE